MNKFEVLFAVGLLMLSAYALIIDSMQLLPFILLGLSVLSLLSGVRELKQSKKSFKGYLNIVTFFVALIWGVSLFIR